MCNLYTIPNHSHQLLFKLLNGTVPDWIAEDPPPLVYAFSRPVVPIVLADGTCVPASWTYMPPPPKEKMKEMGWMIQTFNAKGEELFQKRTWTEPAKKRRCIVPVVSYTEHQHRGKVNVPYRFFRSDGEGFLLAGLWKFYEEENLYRFSILTMPPNRLNRWVHNSNPRQPVIIPFDKKDIYLQGTDASSIEPFLIPHDEDGMKAEVSFGLNGKTPENPPPPPPWDETPTQASLF